MIDKLILGLEKQKSKGIRSFKLPMGGDNDFNVEELLTLLKKINND
jgi:hypothetical protein